MVVPGPGLVVLERGEDGGGDQHQHRGEEEDEDDALHEDHHHPRPVLSIVALPEPLPQLLLILLELQTNQLVNIQHNKKQTMIT